MKTRLIQFLSAASALLAAASITACSAGDASESDAAQGDTLGSNENLSLGTTEQGVMSCANPDGTNAAMAALAVAVAQDLGRWQAVKDFNVSPGYLVLSSGSDADGAKGKSRCSDGKCARVQAILDMQLDAARGKVWFQGSGTTKVLLDPPALKSRLVAKYNEQVIYDSRAKDGAKDQPAKEQHKLSFVSAAKGGCDTNFTFQATKTNGQPLVYVNQLKYNLGFADIRNPYISFTNLGGGKVSIDPTWGLNEDGTSSGGACQAICTKVSLANVAGQCCSCGGVSKSFVKAAWSATTYTCGP
jgi:hypothetical protein